MSFIRYFRKIEFLDSLIRRKATGNQKEFAKKARMSRSTLNEYLNEMKQLNFPIKFDRTINSYYYEDDGTLVKSFFEKKITTEEMQHYKGGAAPLYITDLIFFQDNLKFFFFCLLNLKDHVWNDYHEYFLLSVWRVYQFFVSEALPELPDYQYLLPLSDIRQLFSVFDLFAVPYN